MPGKVELMFVVLSWSTCSCRSMSTSRCGWPTWSARGPRLSLRTATPSRSSFSNSSISTPRCSTSPSLRYCYILICPRQLIAPVSVGEARYCFSLSSFFSRHWTNNNYGSSWRKNRWYLEMNGHPSGPESATWPLSHLKARYLSSVLRQ